MPGFLGLDDGLDLGSVLSGREEVAFRGAFQTCPGGEAHEPRAREVGVIEADGVAGEVVRGERHGVDDAFDLVGQHGVEEALLVVVVGVHLSLAHPGFGRDSVDARAGDAVGGELCGGGVQESAPAGLGSVHIIRVNEPVCLQGEARLATVAQTN